MVNPFSEKDFYLQLQTQRAIFHLRGEVHGNFPIIEHSRANRYATFWQGNAFKRGQNDHRI